MNPNSFSYRAEWVVPIDRPPIKNGVVRVENGLVFSVDNDAARSTNEIDLGAVVLMPGLVNAHTHLEFSDLTAPLGQPGIEFTEWIKWVVRRRTRSSTPESQIESKARSIACGLRESSDCGVVLVGEISTRPLCAPAYANKNIESIAFVESLGRGESEVEAILSSVEEDLLELETCSLSAGISPHAPYSVGDRLLEGLVDNAISKKIPIAMHIAESKAELELIGEGRGAFVPLLKSLGAWQPATYSRGTRPMDYLIRLSRAPRSLLIHCNYLDGAELNFVAQHRDRMTPVYCPRTHRFFGHERYPLKSMLQRGIAVAVGTDSRASNPDLSLLAELKTIHETFPKLPPKSIVRMGTINGAAALGRQDDYGSITPGKKAAFCLIERDGSTCFEDPYLTILYGRAASPS